MSKGITLLVPAAGSSTRFRAAGIDRTKALIPFRRGKDEFERPMLEHAVGFGSIWNLIEHAVVITHASHALSFRMGLSPNKFAVQAIHHTRGQADTVLQGLAHVPDGPVLIVNCDQGFAEGKIFDMVTTARLKGYGIAALVFDGEGSHAYSYIDNCERDFPVFYGAVEKRPVSRWALAGAFYFSNARALANAISKMMEAIGDVEEPYLSEAMGNLGPGHAHTIARNEIYQWGTPEDLANDTEISHLPPDVVAALSTYKRSK